MRTGMNRKVDELGRIVLPIELRRTMNIREGDHLDIAVEGERICLSVVETKCACCGDGGDTLIMVEDAYLCPRCIEAAKSRLQYHSMTNEKGTLPASKCAQSN